MVVARVASKYRRRSGVDGVKQRGAIVPPVVTSAPAKRKMVKKGVAGVTPRPVPKPRDNYGRNKYGIEVRKWPVRTSDERFCDEGCFGTWVGTAEVSMWIHDNDCNAMRCLWKAHGWKIKDWACPWGCSPMDMPSVFTHNWECTFWQLHPELTPFDREKGKFYEPATE